MIRALNSAATGLKAQQTNLDIVSNNIANVNTVGYKKARAEFKDLAYDTVKSPSIGESSVNPETLQIGLGCEVSGTNRLFFQGSLNQTGNPFDMAIDGKGFFKVKDIDGSYKYTRDGSFKIDSEGRLVTSSGLPLEPEIIIPSDAKEVSISSSGTVSAVLSGDSNPSELGKIELSLFPNPSGLKALGSNIYEVSAASGEPADALPGLQGAGTIRQGYLEASNVEIVDEMVRMLSAQRAFEINSKAMEAADDMLRIVNNIKI